MLTKSQLDELPEGLSTFLKNNAPTKEVYQNILDKYTGRLSAITKQISAPEIIDFFNFICRNVDHDEKESETEKIKNALREEYTKDTDISQAKSIFGITDERNLATLTFDKVPLNKVAKALWQKNEILAAFNHPLRIKIRNLYSKDIQNRTHANSPYKPFKNLRGKFSSELINGPLRSFDEYVIPATRGEKVSRRLAMALGVYTVSAKNQISIPFGSETMYSVMGNSTALADIVRCHGIASAPRNGFFADPENQAALINETLRVLDSTLLLEGRDDKDLILEQWKSNLGILVEGDPYKACKRIEIVLKKIPENAIGHVRVYLVEGSEEMVNTAQIIKKYFPKLKIHIGQIIHEGQAVDSENVGVNSIGIGIASGSRCSTGARSGVSPQNVNLLFRIRAAGVGTPIFTETGVPIHSLPVALACGVRRVNYTAGILGFLSANGHWNVLKDQNETLLHPYDGEAGDESKRREKRVYSWDMPIMLEGVDGWSSYDHEQIKYPTIPHKLWYLSETVVLLNTFHRHLFLEDLIYDDKISIVPISNSIQKQVLPFSIY